MEATKHNFTELSLDECIEIVGGKASFLKELGKIAAPALLLYGIYEAGKAVGEFIYHALH